MAKTKAKPNQNRVDDPLDLDPKQVYFVPLGGSEQFGVNLNLYAYDGQWLAVDCGIGFATDRFPGIDILLPDPSFIEDRADKLAGLVITHAHEDHVGAVPYLWPRLKVPIYCTPFTAAVLRKKFMEAPECKGANIHIVKNGEAVEIGPFKAHFVPVAHSIPDTSALILETKAGTIVHSGDWNLDPSPVIGPPGNDDAFKAAGKKGVMAYVGDSTNAAVDGRAGSESDVEKGLAKVFKSCRGRIAVTLFASNVGRIRSICRAAEKTDRSVCLVGRSLHSMVAASREVGLLNDVPDFIGEEDTGYLADDNVVYIVTGSQGEARAQLSRIARGDHPLIKLGKGDTVVFSARPIPGNETLINSVKNNLSAAGVKIITPLDTSECIHVSGHPCRDEIADMYQWLKPRLVVPVHGERTQLEAQADLARKCQIKNVIVPNNGSVICLGPNEPEIIDHVETGLIAVEARRLVDADHASIVQRRKLQYTGAVHVSVVVDKRGDLVSEPLVTTIGIIDPENPGELEFEEDLAEEVADILSDMRRGDRCSDHAVQEEIRLAIRRVVLHEVGLKAKTTVHVIRV